MAVGVYPLKMNMTGPYSDVSAFVCPLLYKCSLGSVAVQYVKCWQKGQQMRLSLQLIAFVCGVEG